MHHHIPFVAPFLLSSLFSAACGNGTSPPVAARPAIVVQPQPAGEVSRTSPDEIRVHHEPELASRTGGKVIRRLVEVGEWVKKDRPLTELDLQDVRLQPEAARIQISATETNLQATRAEYRRYRTLLDRNLVSHSQFRNIQNSYRVGEARLEQIRAEFNVANNQTGYAVLRLFQDGVIANRRVEVGQVVVTGQMVFSLTTDGGREALIGLPEHGSERFRIGQLVSVELQSQRDRRLIEHIREPSSAADPQSRILATRAAPDDRVTSAELGQSAWVYVVAAETVPLSVPLLALAAEAGQMFV